jgi:hypothetical protein
MAVLSKNRNSLFAALRLVLGVSMLFAGCGVSEESAEVKSIPNQNQVTPTPSDKVSFPAEAENCKSEAIVREGLEEPCRMLKPQVVHYLYDNGLLIVTLTGLKEKSGPGLDKRILDTINRLNTASISYQYDFHLPEVEVQRIAQEVKNNLNTNPRTLSESETQLIADKVNGHVSNRQILMAAVLLFITLIAGCVLSLLSFIKSRQNNAALDELPHLLRTGSPGDGQELSKNLEQLQIFVTNLNKYVVEQSEKNAEDLYELKEMLKSAPQPEIPKPRIIVSASPVENPPPSIRSSSETVYVAALVRGEQQLSVDGYMERFGANSSYLTLDRYGENLVETDDYGELLLIRLEPTRGIAIPNHRSFSRPDMFAYYENFYERYGSEMTGDVWIRKPAIVKYADGDWKLYQKGVLELK